MSTVAHSCINCLHEERGYCEWGDEQPRRPPWVAVGRAIALEGGNDMGAFCEVWELREEPWAE